MTDITKVIPTLSITARVINEDSNYYLRSGSDYSEMNESAKEIIELIDGCRTIGDIVMEVSAKHGLTNREVLQPKIIDFIYDIWEQRVYLNHEIDIDLAINRYRNDDLVFLPAFIALPAIELAWLSPEFKSEYYRDPISLVNCFGSLTASVGHLNSKLVLDKLLLTCHTPSETVFELRAEYGGRFSGRELRNAAAVLHKHASRSTQDMQQVCFLKTYELAPSASYDCAANEEIAYRLRAEFEDGDLLAVLMRP